MNAPTSTPEHAASTSPSDARKHTPMDRSQWAGFISSVTAMMALKAIDARMPDLSWERFLPPLIAISAGLGFFIALLCRFFLGDPDRTHRTRSWALYSAAFFIALAFGHWMDDRSESQNHASAPVSAAASAGQP